MHYEHVPESRSPIWSTPKTADTSISPACKSTNLRQDPVDDSISVSNDASGFEAALEEPPVPGQDCSCTGVSTQLRDQISHNTKSRTGIYNDHDVVRVLSEFIHASTDAQSLDHVCHYHLQWLTGHVGLQTRSMRTDDLQYWLWQSWLNRERLRTFRTEGPNATMFRLGRRDPVEADKHGVYSRRAIRRSLLIPLTNSRAASIVDELAGPGAWERWVDDGNLMVPDMFTWLWKGLDDENGKHEAGVGHIIDSEFDLYLYHQGRRNGQANRGWLRTMYYGLVQQAIRQDIGYWALYVCLRPDHQQKLIAYPYYAKYALPQDLTFFQHLDLNVRQFLETGKGGNIIQGSVSLDDETFDGCTTIIPGFHHRIQEWWARVVQRQEVPDGRITGMAKIWHPEDAQDFGAFVPVPAQRGTVRITRPEIPHGSTANSRKIRRTILPWFVGIDDNHEQLDNPESESWGQLSQYHARQEAPQLTPSGHPNKYGPIPYRFPASIPLWLESAISHALRGNTTWDDPRVQWEANLLLGLDREAAQAAIVSHRCHALREIKKCWDMVRHAEQEFFEVDSFFAHNPSR